MSVTFGNGGTINLGRVDGIATHFSDREFDPKGPPPMLCAKGGDRLPPNFMHLFTTDRAKVTCTACLEWLHA